MRTPFTVDEVQIIRNSEVDSLAELSRQLGRNPCSVRRKCLELGKIIGLPYRRYFYDPAVLSEWSDDMAWVLGVIASDGSLNNRTLALEVNCRDVDLIQKVSGFFKSNAPMKFTSKPNIVLVRFHSKAIVDRLVGYGLYQNKSATLPMLDVPPQYVAHFMRGYFDGDGSLSKYGKRIRVSILGSQEFCTSARDLFGQHFGSVVGCVCKNRQDGRIYRLCLSGCTSAAAFLKWIYADSQESNRLNRKFTKYQKWLGSV